MKQIKFLITLVIVFCCVAANAQQMQKLPLDKNTRTGKLDNGLTYYIRHNEFPEHVANFYIAQRVGSIQEEDSQRGLAHFLEHMAFNGSTHFKENGIIEFTRSLGVAFGQDLNAYTSIEQTVYNIDNVPTTRQSALDSCMLVLKDWSNGLLLEDKEIDKERGVIHGEWATRNSATQRLLEKNLPLMYPNSRYGYRLPIGTMEVVDHFAYNELRDYYKKWYHPENQAIIVVGDIDVDYTENKIKELFSDIKADAKAAHVTPIAVPDNEEAIYISDKDKEMKYTMMELFLKSDPFPTELKGTQLEYVQSYISSLISMMFNSRTTEISQDANCPFSQLHLYYGNYLISKTKDAYSLSAMAKEGKDKETFEAMIREVKRVKEFGFTPSEFVRAKEEFLSMREKEYSNRDKRKNTEYYQECVQNYLDGDAMPGAEMEYQLWQALAQQVTLDMINQVLKQQISIDQDKNLVAFIFAQEKEGNTYLSTDDMKNLVASVRAEKLEAWVDNTKNEPLITTLPKVGSIKSEKKNNVLGYTELQLSNGAKVILKKTDFKDNEVLLSGWAEGGQAVFGKNDFSNLKVFGAAARTFGLGNFSNNELEKALAGKQASINFNLGNRYANVRGNSTPKDIETMMQLLYLSFTQPQKDEKAFNKLIQQLETLTKNRDLEPETQISDSVTARMNCYNERYSNLTLKDVKAASLDRIFQIAKESYSDANNFTFAFVGNFDEATIRPLICQYIASLPGKAKPAKTSDIRTYFKGNIDCQFNRKMETPKPYIIQIYNAPAQNTLENSVLAEFAGEVLSMMLLKSVREDAGAAYSVGSRISLNATKEKTYAIMQIYAPISSPEKVDLALDLMKKDVDQLSTLADADMVDKVKANLLKQADVDAKSNNHWLGNITDYQIYNVDFQTNYKKVVESITPEKVSKFLKDTVLSGGNHLKVVMRPE